MAPVGTILFVLSFCLWATPPIGTAEPNADVESSHAKVVLKWLGNADWGIGIGETISGGEKFDFKWTVVGEP